MKREICFADYTVNQALSRGLCGETAEKIRKILDRYPVDCFDLGPGVLSQKSALDGLLPDPRMRVCVRPSDAAVRGFDKFQKVRFRWKHSRGNRLDPLYRAAKAADSSERYLALENADEMVPDEFMPYFQWAQKTGAKGIIYCGNGKEDVDALCGRLAEIMRRGGNSLLYEFEGPDILGLASAQALAAVRAGVKRVSASAGGVGGMAPMEEVMMAAKYLLKYDVPRENTLAADFQRIFSLLGIRLPCKKALIGPDVFAHESGIHVDGIVKDPATYEVIPPEEVGQQRKLVIGKHSGAASLQIRFSQWGIRLSREEASRLLESVRGLVQEQKGPLSDRQLTELFDELRVKEKTRV